MVELRHLDGHKAGTVVPLTRFPFSIGRKDTDLVLAESGVWDVHVLIEVSTDRRFAALPQPPAPLSVSGRVVAARQPLPNGAVLDVGSVRLQFRISATRQRSLAALEALVWTGLAVLAAAQAGLALAW